MEQELRRSPRRLRRCEHCIWTDLVGWDLQSFWKAYFLQYSLGKTKDSSRFGELSMRGAHNKIFDRIWNQTLFHCQSCWCFTVYACMTSTSDFVEYANEMGKCSNTFLPCVAISLKNKWNDVVYCTLFRKKGILEWSVHVLNMFKRAQEFPDNSPVPGCT